MRFNLVAQDRADIGEKGNQGETYGQRAKDPFQCDFQPFLIRHIIFYGTIYVQITLVTHGQASRVVNGEK